MKSVQHQRLFKCSHVIPEEKCPKSNYKIAKPPPVMKRNQHLSRKMDHRLSMTRNVQNQRVKDCPHNINGEKWHKSLFKRLPAQHQDQGWKVSKSKLKIVHAPSMIKSVQNLSVQDYPSAISDDMYIKSKQNIAHLPSGMKGIQNQCRRWHTCYQWQKVSKIKV